MARLGSSKLMLITAAIAAGILGFLRRSNVKQAAQNLGTKVPKGAMLIRRDSLVDLTVDGRPVRQTVFVAESADDEEILAGVSEEVTLDDTDEPDVEIDTNDEHVEDPGEDNATATMTGLAPRPEDAGDVARKEAAELYAEAEAVLAEANQKARAQQPISDSLGKATEELASKETTSDDADSSGQTPEKESVANDQPQKKSATRKSKAKPQPGQVTGDFCQPDANGACPTTHAIKARYATGQYYEPNSKSYDSVVADLCFATTDEAKAAGFSRAAR